jgi:transglutaminase-like putative cysteine protease
MFAKLNNLPRDSRDTLFLLAVIAWVVLPQISNLPLWCSALAAGVLVWRGTLALQNKPLPSKWWLLALLVVTVAATLNTHRTLMGRDAGVTMIVVLLALKTLELRAKRDAFVVFFLSFFTMLTNFFFSQSLLTAAAMLIALLGLLTALVNAHMPVGKPPLLQAAKTAGFMALLGAPVMALLFILFPRMAPLWGVPSDAMSGRSGLSASMQVGNIASLALDESIALRVRFTGPPPPQSALYFRGPVLSSFNGRDWQPLRSNLPSRLQLPANLQISGPETRYEVTLEPNNRPWVILLDAAPVKPALAGSMANAQVAMTPDLQWIADRPFTDLARYSATSHTSFRYGPNQVQAGLREYVDLPPGSNPRTLQLAADLLNNPVLRPGNAPDLVNAVLDRLRTGGYQYTLEPGVFGTHTADEFWFDRKEGFCEHIASSFVILMRALDVPARVVTGYQGGERNAVDGFWVIRQSDAHAWAEVWMVGQGWVRVDPTSAVAPGRTGSFARLQAPQGVIAGALTGVFGVVNPSLLANLRATWEAVNNGWNQWVLNYTQTKQLNLLKDIGFESPSWEDLFYVLLGILVFVSLCGALWTLWEKSRHDPWLRLLWRARKRLVKAGISLAPNAPPRTIADKLDTGQTEIRNWLLRLEAMRYSKADSNRLLALAGMQREFRQLPWPSPRK